MLTCVGSQSHAAPSSVRGAPALPALVQFKNIKTAAESRWPSRRMDRLSASQPAAQLPGVELSVGVVCAALLSQDSPFPLLLCSSEEEVLLPFFGAFKESYFQNRF